MVHRHNHYEAAFEAFLRATGTPYIAVDEARRALFGDATLKSLDFIVAAGPGNLLVDIKGRRFPAGSKRRFWRNWATRDDLTGLARWEQLFGPLAQGLLIFAYHVTGELSPLPAEELFEHRERRYAFIAIRLADYAMNAAEISPKWGTLAMSIKNFRRLARPLSEWLDAARLTTGGVGFAVLDELSPPQGFEDPPPRVEG